MERINSTTDGCENGSILPKAILKRSYRHLDHSSADWRDSMERHPTAIVAQTGAAIPAAASWPDNACRSGNEYVTICGVDQIEIREYLDAAGRSLFARWYEKLNATAAARVTISLARLGQANFSNVEGVGGGVYEN